MSEYGEKIRFSAGSDAPLQLSGYLMKKSTKGDWQRRYFETTGTYLTYYKTNKRSKLLAALSVPQVGAIRLLDNSDSKENGATFQIDLKDRQYILKAESLDEATRWVNFLTALRDSKPHSLNPLSEDYLGLESDESTASFAIEATGSIQKAARSRWCCCKRR